MRVSIVGAGIAGLACAHRLTAAGHAVTLFDKGRGPGGRMSTRRIDTAAGDVAFDHGAQYFTVRDPGFAAEVERWAAAGIAARWPAAGPDAWVGTPAMNMPVKHLAAGQDVHWGMKVDSLWKDARGWALHGYGVTAAPADAVVVAIPAEQAAPLLRRWHEPFATAAAACRSDPCWTVMAAFDDPLPVERDSWRGDAIIGWAARNVAKPGRTGPESWVIQAGPAWSTAHVEDDPATVEAALLGAFADMTGTTLPPALVVKAHRWRFARAGTAEDLQPWDAEAAVGLCGDWTLGPRVEAAWLSGDRLARAMLRE